MRYRELAKRLRTLGCHEMRGGKGSHHVWHNPATGKIVALPKRHLEELILREHSA